MLCIVITARAHHSFDGLALVAQDKQLIHIAKVADPSFQEAQFLTINSRGQGHAQEDAHHPTYQED